MQEERMTTSAETDSHVFLVVEHFYLFLANPLSLFWRRVSFKFRPVSDVLVQRAYGLHIGRERILALRVGEEVGGRLVTD